MHLYQVPRLHESAETQNRLWASMCPLPGPKGALSLGVVRWRASCEPKQGGLRWKVSRLQEVAAWKEELKTVQAHSNTR